MQRGQTQYTKAIDQQLDLLRFYSTPEARQFFLQQNQLGETAFGHNHSSTETGDALIRALRAQLAFATPMYVAPHIAHMLEDAMPTFPSDITIQPTDFPSLIGFVYLDAEWLIGATPSGSVDYMSAFSWACAKDSAHIMIYGPNRMPGYSTKADHLVQLNEFDIWHFGTPYDVDSALEQVAQVADDATVPWAFIDQYGRARKKDISTKDAVLARYLNLTTARKAVYAVLHFMNQKIVAKELARMPRAHRRHLPKAYRGQDVVQIITLRGYESSAHPYEQAAEHGREWASRWVVRGHWRKQWYPAEQTHKPIWIDAYVKGPDGLPVKNATKLFAVTR